MRRAAWFIISALAWVACESVPELPDTAPLHAQRVRDAAEQAQSIHVVGEPPEWMQKSVELTPQELREFRELMQQGRPTRIRSARSVLAHTGRSLRFSFIGADKKLVGKLHDYQIWSESREAEELARLESSGACHCPPMIVLPDAAWKRLQEFSAVQKWLSTWRQTDLKKPAEDVLFSATAKMRQGMPDKQVVFLQLEEGLGASREERLEAFKKLYDLGESIDKRDEYNYTGLGYACALGKLDEVKALLERGPDLKHGAYHPDDEETCGCCVTGNFMPGYVKVALKNGHRDVARYLLSRKAAPVGVAVCLEQDDRGMLQELLAAGGSVHETERHDEPCTMNAKSPEMIRFLLGKGCRKMSPLECLFRIRQWHDNDAKAEAALRELFLKAGCLSRRDIDEFDKGGLAGYKGEWGLLSLPATGKKSYDENYDWSWLRREEAWKILARLAGTSHAAQDAATLDILRRVPSRRGENCASTIFLALRVVGDERFAAQVDQLPAQQRANARVALESGLDRLDDRMMSWAEYYPLSARALRK